MALVDDLLGSPTKTQVAAATKYVNGFESTTQALVALVAAVRSFDSEQAAIIESICEVMAELEVEQM